MLDIRVNVPKMFLLTGLILNIFFVGGFSEKNATFIATAEWQEIAEDQAIPAGLHVRINLQSGKKEAKLLDNSEEANKSQLQTVAGEDVRDGLEDALKHIPNDRFEYSVEKIKQVKKKFKNYDDIKKDRNVMPKTDAELVEGLMERFANLSAQNDDEDYQKDIVETLESLEFLLHQIDNADQFVAAKGLEKIILPNIVNQSVAEIRVKSLRILGVVVQNNHKAKVYAFEKNAGDYLMRIVASSKLTNELSAAVFALGSLLRKFPFVQKEILHKSGMVILVSTLTRSLDLKVQVKVLTLLGDLLHESGDAKTSADELTLTSYKDLNFEKLLEDGDFCHAVETFLDNSRSNLVKDVSAAEQVLTVLELGLTLCYENWSESPLLRHTILVFQNRFLAETDEFILETGARAKALQEELYKHVVIKDEL